MMKRILLFCLTGMMLIMLCSCGGQDAKANIVTDEPAAADTLNNNAPSVTPTPEAAPVESPDSMSPTPRPGYSTTQTIFPIDNGDNKRYPIIENTTGRTLIERVSSNDDSDASFMLVTKSGKIVVMDPRDMPDQKLFKIKPDIITITHNHGDHNDASYTNTYIDTAKILTYKTPNDLTLDDIHVYSIVSAHTGNTLIPKLPTNIIFVYETDGLRIANLGDIGQTKLTDEQLKQIGAIDIVITQLDNSASAMNYMTDTKAKDIIAQLNPKIIIPAHGGDLYAEDIAEFLGADYEMLDTILATDATELKDAKQRVVLIKQLEEYE